MPITIIRKGGAVEEVKVKTDAAPAIVKKTNPPPFVEGRPKLAKSIQVGDSIILPDLDVHDVQGKQKFLVNFRRPGMVFKIRSYDEETKQLKLLSNHGTVFDSKIDGAAPRNYMVVVEPEGADKPGKEAVGIVLGLLGKETPDPIAAAAAKVVETAPPHEPPPVSKKPTAPVPVEAPPVKKGGVTIIRRQK